MQIAGKFRYLAFVAEAWQVKLNRYEQTLARAGRSKPKTEEQRKEFYGTIHNRLLLSAKEAGFGDNVGDFIKHLKANQSLQKINESSPAENLPQEGWDPLFELFHLMTAETKNKHG